MFYQADDTGKVLFSKTIKRSVNDLLKYILFISLEIILLFGMVVSKEGNSISHHPNVSTPTVIIGFMPLPVLVPHGEDLLLLHGHVAHVDDLLVKACKVESHD